MFKWWRKRKYPTYPYRVVEVTYKDGSKHYRIERYQEFTGLYTDKGWNHAADADSKADACEYVKKKMAITVDHERVVTCEC